MHLCRLNNLSYVFSKEDCIFSCYVMTSRPSITAIPGVNFWVVVLAINISLTNLLIIDAEQNHLVLTLQLQPKHLYIQGQTLTYQSLVIHKPNSNETAANVSLDWVLPSYISYQSYKSLSKTPNNVATNIDKFATKFGSLSPSEEINILINVTVDPGHTLPDNHFHHATVSTTLKYSWLHQCSKEITLSNVLHIPFFSPVCSDFGSLGVATGNIKDSQIQASTVRTYRSSDNSWAWEPMTSFFHLNEKRKMKFNFLQIDLKSSRPVDIVFVDGIPARDPIPWNIIQLSFSDNKWRWETQKNLQTSKVFYGEDTVAVAITTLTPIKTRFIRINVPPYGVLGGASYKVQVFGCNPNQILDPDSSPVGIESSSLVPDSRFNSPSILGLQYQPHFGRLNTKVGGGSWCASGCSPLQYLQIDLGDTWRISEIENQGRHSTNGNVVAVKTYSLSSSLDGAVWTPYKTNGRTKIFWGNDVVNLATRHKLFQPLTVNIIRFEPRTCTESVACMRVELYGTKTSVVGRKVSPGVVFGRSMLLKPAENIVFVCNTEVSENNAYCFSTKDKGSTWKGIPVQILSILAFDPIEKRLYGLSRNGKNIMKSKDPNGEKWRGIPLKRWLSVRDGSSLFTAVEIPFVPISRNETNVIEPIVQLTAFSGDKWQADQIGVYHKPAGGSSKMVLSFLPYSQDLSSNPCHTGVCTYGRCEQLVCSQFKCHCREGYTGRFCDTATNYCSTNPCQNGGTCSPLFLSFKCSCQPGYSGDRCQDYDECISSPCLNGGTCADGDNNFTCTCAPNYSGVTCQEFDHCSSSPCLYRGTCTDGASSYTCSCLPGYSGTNCQVTPCSPGPCLNGGTCSHPDAGGFLCACTIQYSGTRCETVLDQCISSPCLNGGTCVDGDNSFTCTCAPNYSGVTCQEFDECSSSPCQNGGTCTDGASSYTCSCLTRYSGTKCEVTPCSSGPCLNGGTCSHPDAGGFLCACTIQYSGTHCRNGPFLLQRGFLSSSTSDVWSTSSGKFDKIVFHSDKNLTVLAVCISDTFAFGSVACPFETRIRKEGTTTILVSISGNANCKKDTMYSICPHFASPYRIEAGTRYILEVRMTSTANIRKVINGLSSRTISLSDGSPSVTFNYETVDAAELADSNGSNQSEGGIVGLVVQIAN